MNKAPLDIKFAQRLPSNIVSNVIYFALNIIIGLVLVPFFLDTLGPAAYGLIPLATSITSYIALVIDALNISISRFLTVDLNHSDVKRANQTFNTALFGTLGAVLILVPIVLMAAWYAPYFFNIGSQSALDVSVLFALIFGSALVRAWSSNFMVILFAYNRLDLRNYLFASNLLMQLGLVVLLFALFGPSLVLVGISYMGASLATLLLAAILSKRTYRDLRITPSLFVRSRMKEIGSMSSWVLINSIGLLLNTQVALFLVNKMFGDVAGTEYSFAVSLTTILVAIAGLMTNLFTPMTYSYYAREDREGLIHFTSMALKSTGLLMALPIALVCMFSPQILTFWVGAEFAHLAPLVWICVAPVIFSIMASCIAPITVAYERVNKLVILTLPLGLLNVGLAVLFPFMFNIGYYGVALAGLITLLLRYAVVNPMFIASIVRVPLMFYLKKMMYGVGGLAVLSGVGIAITLVVNIDSLPLLLAISGVIAVAYILLVVQVFMQDEERRMIRSCLPLMFQKLVPSWLL